ncbi:MAG: hypothetical protein CO022_01935 [Flavobacteriales bacterium CG_4_9_14_0_2_um_filter_32_27]|nr:MAG: hypothetical protein CO022_01935 [Flavobacteriales bacterium CG_4_9_14_0_2_um_filter_32_27]
MNFKYFLSLILLLLFSFSIFSQDQIVIHGLLKTKEGKNISDASIFIPEINKGVVSNQKGDFFFEAKKELIIFLISHLNYYPKTYTLYEVKFNEVINDTLNIVIILEEKINELSSFEISSEKIELLYNEPFVTILDYQFYENKLLLLSKTSRSTTLKLVGFNGKELAKIIAPKNSTYLHKDCFGNIHLLSTDSAFQILVESQNLEIIYSVSIQTFNLHLKPCVSNIKNTFIFKQEDIKNQAILYYYVDESKRKYPLKEIIDSLGQVYALQRANSIKKIQNPAVSKMSENKISIYEARSLSQNIAYLDILLKNLIENPLFVINNSVYIFDHTDNTCFIFDENYSYIRNFLLNYQYQKGWDKKLIVDSDLGDVYAKFMKEGLCYLNKINLSNGELIISYKLEKHIYPLNIKVKNGIAYYLYEDLFNHGQMSLFKQGLY